MWRNINCSAFGESNKSVHFLFNLSSMMELVVEFFETILLYVYVMLFFNLNPDGGSLLIVMHQSRALDNCIRACCNYSMVCRKSQFWWDDDVYFESDNKYIISSIVLSDSVGSCFWVKTGAH